MKRQRMKTTRLKIYYGNVYINPANFLKIMTETVKCHSIDVNPIREIK